MNGLDSAPTGKENFLYKRPSNDQCGGFTLSGRSCYSSPVLVFGSQYASRGFGSMHISGIHAV
jgi:hypothetical protein